MNLREIADEALDSWAQDTMSPAEVVQGEAEDGIFDAVKAGVQGIKQTVSGAMPTHGNTARMSEAQQAQAMAGQNPAQQAQTLFDHDKRCHKGSFDPSKGNCTIREKFKEAMAATGQQIDSQVAEKIGKPGDDKADESVEKGKARADAAQSGADGHDAELKKFQDLKKNLSDMFAHVDRVKRAYGEGSAEYIEAESQLRQVKAQKDEQLKKALTGILGETEAEAAGGLIEKAKRFKDKVLDALENIKQKMKEQESQGGETEQTKNIKNAVDTVEAEVKENAGDKPEEVTPPENTETPPSAENPEATVTKADLERKLDEARRERNEKYRTATPEQKAELKANLDKAKEELARYDEEHKGEALFDAQERAKQNLDDARAEYERLLSNDAEGNRIGTDEQLAAAIQKIEEAEADYNEALEEFEEYDDNEALNGLNRSVSTAGIDPKSISEFKRIEEFLREEPDFYEKHPHMLKAFESMAQDWARIQTDNPAMQRAIDSLKESVFGNVAINEVKDTLVKDWKKRLKRERNPDIQDAYRIAIAQIQEKDADPSKIKKSLMDAQEKAQKMSQSSELHVQKLQKEMSNAAKAAEQAFAAQQKNQSEYRDKTIKESQPEIYNAVEQELQDEMALGEGADPTKVASLRNILQTLANDRSKKNIDKAIEQYGKGWSHTAKNKQSMDAIKAQNVEDDNLEKTWVESNAEGDLKNLDAAIAKLEKRKDDWGVSATAQLKRVRDELAESHSQKRVGQLLKEWGHIVGGGGNGKIKKRGFNYDAYDPYESTKKNYKKVDKQAVEDSIMKSLAKGKVNEISATEKANTVNTLKNVFLVAGKNGVSVKKDDPNAPKGSEKDPNYHGVINGPSFTNYVLDIPKDGSFDKDKAEKLLGNIQAALGLPDKRKPLIANIDGKLVVQVPKEDGKRDVVTFGDLLSSPEWAAAKNGVKNADGSWKQKPMHLPVIIGHDSLGRAIVRDFKKMKHLLIAGQTGQGKSVGLNTVLASLTLAKEAGEIDIDLIDMKGGMALGTAAKLPHSRGDVARTSDEAMQRIVDFKKRMDEQANILGGGYDGKSYADVEAFNEAHPEHPLRDAFLIIDEAADLAAADKNVFDPLTNIAQMGRAPGFHLIVATQRPDAKTLPSAMTGQMPGKMIYHTKNATESRLLTDDYTSDAANLLGAGDMLFNDGTGFERSQTAFINDENGELDTVYDGVSKGHEEDPSQGGGNPPNNPPGGGGGGGGNPPNNPPSGGAPAPSPTPAQPAASTPASPSAPAQQSQQSAQSQSQASPRPTRPRQSTATGAGNQSVGAMPERKENESDADYIKRLQEAWGGAHQASSDGGTPTTNTDEPENLPEGQSPVQQPTDSSAQQLKDNAAAQSPKAESTQPTNPVPAQQPKEDPNELSQAAQSLAGAGAERLKKMLGKTQKGTPQYQAIVKKLNQMAVIKSNP